MTLAGLLFFGEVTRLVCLKEEWPMTEYTIVIEEAGTNLAGYVIGLDGVMTTGNTFDQVIENMREAIPFHLEGMGLHGDQRPRALPIVKTIQIAS